jgi:hypothetical protein
MSSFGPFGQGGMFDETGLGPIELVEYTEISSFEASGLLTTEDVADYVRETLPPSHLENCPSIQYQPECNGNYPSALGSFDRTTNEICIWTPPEGLESSEDVLETITHEIGHNVHENIIDKQPEVAVRWAELHQQSWEMYIQDGTGFVSGYAQTNVYEDFAETYQTYVQDPEKLIFFNPEKYEFMRENVFFGQDYLSTSNILLSEC